MRKSILLTVVLATAMLSTYAQKTISLKLNAQGNLLLSGFDYDNTTELNTTDMRDIEWRIKDSRIQSFKIQAKQSVPQYPFTSTPINSFQQYAHLQVTYNFTHAVDWYYSINMG